MRLSTHHLTCQGGRRSNEDALKEAVRSDYSILVLADGLGGHGGGALAARQCVETVVSAFLFERGLSDTVLHALVEQADQAIAALRTERRQSADSMRTTVALLAVCGDKARWAHVGDSRVYWFREGVLMQRTRDHTVSELVMGLQDGSPAAPPDPADRHRLLRALGGGQGCRPELGATVVTLHAGDAFLLCSDGLWGLVSDREIADCLSQAPTPRDWCIALEQRLDAHLRCAPRDDHDNYSVIAAMVLP